MQATEVTNRREPTGKTREKTSKWEGTCWTCDRCTKRGFCNAGGSWDSYVKTPDQFCADWSEK